MKETLRIMIDSVATCFDITTANMEREYAQQVLDEDDDIISDLIWENAHLHVKEVRYQEIIAGLCLLLAFSVLANILL